MHRGRSESPVASSQVQDHAGSLDLLSALTEAFRSIVELNAQAGQASPHVGSVPAPRNRRHKRAPDAKAFVATITAEVGGTCAGGAIGEQALHPRGVLKHHDGVMSSWRPSPPTSGAWRRPYREVPRR